MSRRRALALWLPSVALAVLSTLLALCGAELAVRGLNLGPRVAVVFRDVLRTSENPRLEYELLPGGPDDALYMSSAGLRDVEMPFEKPAGVFRIAAAGDSIAFGLGVHRARCWVEQLEALLGRRSRPGAPRFEVLNLGVPGYQIDQVVERVRVLGLAFQPDLVLYAYVLNDPQTVSIESEALRALEAETAAGRTAGAGPLSHALSRSRLFLWARHVAGERLVSPREPEHIPNDPAYYAAFRGDHAAYFRALHSGSSLARVEARLAELVALTRESDIPLQLILFPLFPDRDGEDPLDDVRGLVASAALRHGIAVLDLAPTYAAARRELGQTLHLDFLHPNRLGHLIAAHALFHHLCAKALLPAGSVDCGAVGPP